MISSRFPKYFILSSKTLANYPDIEVETFQKGSIHVNSSIYTLFLVLNKEM